MPNSYAEKHFRQGKLRALVNLISALQDEELPRERGHSFKAGQVEKYLDLDSPPAAPDVAYGAAGSRGAP